jgi:hypothetical protein
MFAMLDTRGHLNDASMLKPVVPLGTLVGSHLYGVILQCLHARHHRRQGQVEWGVVGLCRDRGRLTVGRDTESTRTQKVPGHECGRGKDT